MVKKLRREYLVCYDVQDDKIRKKISTLLLDFGLKDMQKSVYWGFLSKVEMNAVFKEGERLLQKMDKLLIMPVSVQNREKRYIGHDKNDFKDWDTHVSI